jgi:hypothetical protein
MDEKLLTAFISGAANVTATAALPLAASVLDGHSLGIKRGDRSAGLVGRWSGVIHQRNGVVKVSRVSSCEFTREEQHILGELTIDSQDHGKPVTMFLRTAGYLLNDRFFKSDYVGWLQGREQEEVVQFGSIILEWSTDASTLKGYFIGVGPITGRLVYGSVELMKEIKQ